ncbi:Lysophosphatidylcholine acyltransferase [Gryllus bimaculatus]|nr:Lysophosphatidylcholine acyltransferase [Gryllus bimaculatus]
MSPTRVPGGHEARRAGAAPCTGKARSGGGGGAPAAGCQAEPPAHLPRPVARPAAAPPLAPLSGDVLSGVRSAVLFRSRVASASPLTMNGKLHADDDLSMGADLLNPFVHRLELSTTYEKIKTGVLTVLVLPVRVAAIFALLTLAWLLACVGLLGVSERQLRERPLAGWRRGARAGCALVVRAVFACGGFWRVRVKGRRAAAAEAPVLALAPHSSFCDALPVVCLGAPSAADARHLLAGAQHVPRGRHAPGGEGAAGDARRGAHPRRGPALHLPRRQHHLQLINYTQPVYVWREDPDSRQKTIREIVDRATSPLDWPQVLIFPEGTCTNRSCLITFKPGAFYPGVPVQPVCIRYPNKLDTVTWTWEGPGASCEIEFLPVYHPDARERADPKLFASNVRRLMARALGVPVSDYTYDDCRLLTRAKRLRLRLPAPAHSSRRSACASASGEPPPPPPILRYLRS